MATRGVEATLFSALQELGKVFGEERVMNAAGSVLQTAAQTKAAVDSNVATALGLAGLPSKADLDGLRRQLDLVQVALSGLSRKIDRLTEEVAQIRAQAHEPPHAGPVRKRRPRTRPGSES
jgi:hypothetical protein